MLKQKYAVYALICVFFMYIISIIVEINFVGNILSPLIGILSSLIILFSLKNINSYKPCWVFVSIYPLVWGIADLFWFVYENILLIDPTNVDYINALYTLPNICLAIAITLYYAYNLKKWNLYQLVLDMMTMSYILIVLLWCFIFSKTSINLVFSFKYINTMVYLFFDFYMLSGISVLFISTKVKNISKSLLFLIAGAFFLNITDYYYAYLDLMKFYNANSFVDIIYMLGEVMFALGAVYESFHIFIKDNKSKVALPENIRNPKKTIIAIVLSIGLYAIGFLTLKLFIYCNAISIVYWILTAQIQESIQNKYLLKTELQLNEQLEKLVEERTIELTKANKNLEKISNKDYLTGLYNRRYLISYLNSLISAEIERKFALLYIDTNRFKAINDSYGHQIGDKVLCAISDRFIENCMPNCTAFRIGGDEFAVIIEDNIEKSYVNSVAQKILELIQMPIIIPPYLFTISSSIGIVLYPEDAKNQDLLMRYADIAMYEAKKVYKGNNCLFFDSGISKKIVRKNEVEFLLKSADYDKEFILYYQPQYSINGKVLIGMEALIRWIHPEKGFISPGEFIPIAEETGCIIDIGEWVIDKAFSQIKKWNETYSLNLKISINVSPIQIEKANFVDWLRKKLEKEKINSDWVDLEITEGCAMNPNEKNEEAFALFANMGISTSIDDFGTGYASLSNIKKFNFERLKIAKELIDNIYEDKNALLIVHAIIMLSEGMGLRTIAEGVEDVNQLQILEKLGCDEIQGYIFGKPVPSDEFEEQHINKKLNYCTS